MSSVNEPKEEELKKSVESLTCNICTDEIRERKAVIDSCKHYFCVECIQKWAAIENTCPYCK